MRDTKETVEAIGGLLIQFLKSGPTSSRHIAEIKAQISAIAISIAISPDDATANYERVSQEFLDNIRMVRGLPTRTIMCGDSKETGLVSSSGSHIAQKFDLLLPNIADRFAWCVKNYQLQAEKYRADQFDEFQKLLDNFLRVVPAGGTKDKDIKSQITGIKKELRYFAKWDRQFSTYKTMSFPCEIGYIFELEKNPLAAIWHYCQLDEQGEYEKTYNHKQRANCVYAVRGNWAFEKGLMKAGDCGYIDEISRPTQEVGCMCSLQWVYSVERLPTNMLTAHGCAELARTQSVLQTTDILSLPTETSRSATGWVSRPRRWLGWG
jgi:hypothetical protein